MSTLLKPYRVLAYYHFVCLDDPKKEVALQKAFLNGCDATARIYLSEQGINGQLCLHEKDLQSYMDWMHGRKEFENIAFKIHSHHEHVFPRLTIKYREHLVGCKEKVDLSQRGEYASPEQWKKMLETEENHLLLDVRNSYEWQVGHFKGAELPPCETFRQFEEYAEELAARVDAEKQPVMMYCTGGIRCELYSSILKKKGFEKIYQLEGGVIGYGLEVGSDHWLGKLFVFDDRLAVPISEEETAVIGHCHHCQIESESFYNCANMDCNCLFLCCKSCGEKFLGCCREECKLAPRLRPFQEEHAHKPFRRQHEILTPNCP